MGIRVGLLALTLSVAVAWPAPAGAGPFFFSTGDPDGLIGTASRIPQTGVLGIESADDFLLTAPTRIQHATFIGLITGGSLSIVDLNVDLYHVFPADSDTVRTPNVTTRVNSPADTEFDGRNLLAGSLAFSTTVLNPSFTAANSVLNGINPAPNQHTGGEGPITGQEVQFDVDFLVPFDLTPDHYFFVPTIQLASGEFFWLSAPRPIVPPGTPFLPDLQSWIRNENLDPDWSRVGTDIVGGATFNAAFSLTGETIPEPSTLLLFGSGLVGVAVIARRRRQK
jgi:hypothetical protein